MSPFRRPLRAAVLVALAAVAAPGAGHAQRGGDRTPLTPALLDRFVASYRSAGAEERRRRPDEVEMPSWEEQNAAKDRWEECRDSVSYQTATAAERATMERLQREMQKYLANPQAPRAVALSDTATRLMHAIEARARPAARRRCGPSPEEQEQQRQAAVEAQVSAPQFDVDSAAAAGMGMDAQAFAWLRERIEMYLAADDPKPNGLWSAADLALLGRYRGRLESALAGE